MGVISKLAHILIRLINRTSKLIVNNDGAISVIRVFVSKVAIAVSEQPGRAEGVAP
jgi:hypothetical protein